MEKEIKFVDGHCQLSLPFIEECKFPNNKVQLIARLKRIKRKLELDKKFKNEYVKFMNNLTSKGF